MNWVASSGTGQEGNELVRWVASYFPDIADDFAEDGEWQAVDSGGDEY